MYIDLMSDDTNVDIKEGIDPDAPPTEAEVKPKPGSKRSEIQNNPQDPETFEPNEYTSDEHQEGVDNTADKENSSYSEDQPA